MPPHYSSLSTCQGCRCRRAAAGIATSTLSRQRVHATHAVRADGAGRRVKAAPPPAAVLLGQSCAPAGSPCLSVRAAPPPAARASRCSRQSPEGSCPQKGPPRWRRLWPCCRTPQSPAGGGGGSHSVCCTLHSGPGGHGQSSGAGSPCRVQRARAKAAGCRGRAWAAPLPCATYLQAR